MIRQVLHRKKKKTFKQKFNFQFAAAESDSVTIALLGCAVQSNKYIQKKKKNLKKQETVFEIFSRFNI